jgi:hypothetical protein
MKKGLANIHPGEKISFWIRHKSYGLKNEKNELFFETNVFYLTRICI